MKKKIGTLKGRPIVDGDINLVKYPEIHYNNLRARTFKVEGEELKNEEIKKYSVDLPEVTHYKLAVFPANVIVPKDTIAISMLTGIAISIGDPEHINLSYLQGDIIPANTAILIFSITPEIIFTETFENLPFITHSVGICVYEETTAKDLLNLINSISNNSYKYLDLVSITEEDGITTVRVKMDTIIKKYSVVSVSNDPVV